MSVDPLISKILSGEDVSKALFESREPIKPSVSPKAERHAAASRLAAIGERVSYHLNEAKQRAAEIQNRLGRR